MAHLRKYKVLDNLPPKADGAAVEYISKTLDEAGAQILADNLVKEIHKQSMTVDMTDVSFGTSSGQAMKLKLLTMTMLVKNKIRSMERGLKKRFELYNNWLIVHGEMGSLEREDIDVVFSVQMPIDEQGVVNIVTSLQNIVDDETLLSLLWFVKDPAATIEKVREQKKANQAEYFDTFAFRERENSINAENSEDDGESRNKDEQDDTSGNRSNTPARS